MISLSRDDLFQRVLLAPIGDGCDELHVLSGYASAAFVVFHMLEVRNQLGRDITVHLHVGMTGEDGLELSSHHGFVGAIRALSGDWLRVSYSPIGVSDHSKLYVWRRNGMAEVAWVGSANYSASGFGLAGTRRESMVEVDPASAWHALRSAVERFVPAGDPDVFSRVHIYEVTSLEQRQRVVDPGPVSLPHASGTASVELPLVQTTRSPGEVHNAGAGLNWGQRGKRRRTEAYIPVPAKIAQSGFFPQRGYPFVAHTDDGETIFFTVAQDGDKALHSVPDNATVGVWFRRRLGVLGDAFVTTADLELFGRKSVAFTALDDGSYFMDFRP